MVLIWHLSEEPFSVPDGTDDVCIVCVFDDVFGRNNFDLRTIPRWRW